MDKVIAVEVEFYDYFGGQKRDVKKFNNLLEAWEYYKKSSGLDFNYGDTYQSTREPLIYWTSEVKKTNKHQWKPKTIKIQTNICLDECLPFESDFFVIPSFEFDDEDIII